MGRKREFDYERAVERAMRVFWARGYSRTSIRDLLGAMGIGESSFYYTFGSKQRLYLESLRRYNATVYRRRWEALTARTSIREGIRAFFKIVLDDLDDPRTPNLCLMAGSLSDDVLRRKELEKYVVSEMRRLETALVQRLDSAREAAELPRAFDSDVSAQVIVTFLQGFFRVIRTLKGRSQMEAQVETLLHALGL